MTRTVGIASLGKKIRGIEDKNRNGGRGKTGGEPALAPPADRQRQQAEERRRRPDKQRLAGREQLDEEPARNVLRRERARRHLGNHRREVVAKVERVAESIEIPSNLSGAPDGGTRGQRDGDDPSGARRKARFEERRDDERRRYDDRGGLGQDGRREQERRDHDMGGGVAARLPRLEQQGGSPRERRRKPCLRIERRPIRPQHCGAAQDHREEDGPLAPRAERQARAIEAGDGERGGEGHRDRRDAADEHFPGDAGGERRVRNAGEPRRQAAGEVERGNQKGDAGPYGA